MCLGRKIKELEQSSDSRYFCVFFKVLSCLEGSRRLMKVML